MMPWSIAFFYTANNWLIKEAIGEISCRTVIFIAYVTVIASIFCLIFIAVDRFYAIVYPLRRRGWFRKPKVLTPLLWMLSLALMSVIPVTSDFYSPSSKCGFNFEIWGDEQAGTGGLFIYLFVISYLIPLSFITALYAKTIQKLRYHQIRRDPLNQNLQQQRQQRQQNRKRKKSYSRSCRHRRCICSLLASCAGLSFFYRDNRMRGWSTRHCDVSGLLNGTREQRYQPMVVHLI